MENKSSTGDKIAHALTGFIIGLVIMGGALFRINNTSEIKRSPSPTLQDTLIKRCDSCKCQVKIPLNDYTVSEVRTFINY